VTAGDDGTDPHQIGHAIADRVTAVLDGIGDQLFGLGGNHQRFPVRPAPDQPSAGLSVPCHFSTQVMRDSHRCMGVDQALGFGPAFALVFHIGERPPEGFRRYGARFRRYGGGIPEV